MKTAVSFRIDSKTVEHLKEMAKKDNRSLNNWLETIVEAEYKNIQIHSNKEYGCKTYNGNCDKCNMYFLCDRMPITK